MRRDSWHFVVAGAGGNTGSHLLPHLARMAEVARLTLVDPDVYTAENLAVQNMERADVGRPKVAVQAARLERIRPDLEIAAIQERIEDVPRGHLRCDLFVSCLDSKASRQLLNEIAWRLGVGWFDCGVLGSQDLVRVSGFIPRTEAPCLECSWDQGPHGEYATLEQEYMCGAGATPYPTMASSALGGLAASLMAIEIAKFMHGDYVGWIAGRQLIFEARHHAVQVTVESRNPRCRFDHRTWEIEPWVCALERTTLGAALDHLGSLAIEGHCFADELLCPSCRTCEAGLRLNRPRARCVACNRRLAPADFGALDRLQPPLASEWMRRTLAEIGLRAGDIVNNGRAQYELMEAT